MRNLVFVFSFVFLFSAYGESDREKAAMSAANEWVKLIDDSKYKESYLEAASFFKTKVTEGQWVQSAKDARQPLGKLLSRKVKLKQYTKTLPGAPDGEYVVIQFDSDFEQKKGVVETITPMFDKDKKWHVSGYFIK